MDSLLKFASGISTVEAFARDVYIKSNLTIELDKVIKQLIHENDIQSQGDRPILMETPNVSLLCDIMEAIFLHGLKEKLSTRMSYVFNTKNQNKNVLFLDFWAVILILCHNEELKQFKELKSVATDIGRCRAWLRFALNENLFRSYFNCLICDSSLLNGFYRSSAYLRDSQHTEMMRSLIAELDNYNFHLTIDNPVLNIWSNTTLSYLGVNVQNEDPSLVVTALDAMHLISDNSNKAERRLRKDSFHEVESTNVITKESKAISVPKVKPPMDESGQSRMESTVILKENEEAEERIVRESTEAETPSGETTECIEQSEWDNESELCAGNSLSSRSGWSTQPMVCDDSYDALLESYSTRAVLSSTPDLIDTRPSLSSRFTRSRNWQLTLAESDFEIIPKSIVLNNDADQQKFYEQLSKLAQECGLDQQDYKCFACCRPIGLIYGKCNLCHINGHLYCLECHGSEESVIPAQIIYNWNFKKLPVAKCNKMHLTAIETEPIFDIKILSPSLYIAIPEMQEVLDLRTQLFYLHAYLFTCQENIAVKMRKLVWPREHLFEHIHLYSLIDLQQVYGNALASTLHQVIAFARKHILECNLCKLKGYYCEICKNSQILYPFDTNSTKRCENCKSVFHIKCYDEKYDKHSCPKCLRIAKKKSQE